MRADTPTPDNADARSVLDFWFGAPGTPEHGQRRDAWFRKDAAFDATIAQRFAALIESALAGGLRDWMAQPDSALAHIVLLDQFTRNVYRASPRAFAGDALALESAQAMIANGQDHRLAPVPRCFVYLPFEHAEDAAMQDESIRRYSELVAEAPALHDMLAYAHRHREIIARFGRFPHRNHILGRPSSAEEQVFLTQPGSSF